MEQPAEEGVNSVIAELLKGEEPGNWAKRHGGGKANREGGEREKEPGRTTSRMGGGDYIQSGSIPRGIKKKECSDGL